MYVSVMKQKQKSIPTLPDFEISFSLMDPELFFKKDLYYEIKYRDIKLNKFDLLAYGGVYKVQLCKTESMKSQETNGELKPKPLSESLNSRSLSKHKKEKKVRFFIVLISNIFKRKYVDLQSILIDYQELCLEAF